MGGIENTRNGSNMGSRIARHLLLPSAAPIALVCLYFTPKAVFGCANRGFMALAVVMVATAAAVYSTWKGVSERKRGSAEAADWWMLTTLILLSPVALLFGPLG